VNLAPPRLGRLAGKTAIVSAAAGAGLGQATARRFAQEGANLVLTDAHARRTEEAAARIAAESGSEVLAFRVDVREQHDIDACVQAAIARFGRIDILVNNAGINRPGKLWETSDADWDEVLGVNLTGTFRFTRAVLPHMIAARSGAILNVASIGAWNSNLGGPAQAAYAAAKAGVMAFTRATAAEAGPHGVRANAIAPGLIGNAFHEKTYDASWLQAKAADTVLGRVGRNDDFTGAAVFLCSDEAGFVTGESMSLSGGWYMHP
jgi:3-oxoacyl-[acyl-carrier protein] reductase